ncbi:hypothetical protein [Hydrogenophaga laconesensis]|uniref:Helix-turn-helix domain-containing protein n=1 Tax=Hydrogenophaga laconesensis TaxID=1805971 RepID=A0ABU1VE00_9BURK|nr:hypothetical protein [Hydrogenophaga laconesensis]MDR7095543.1 hypothetical protein [Hydrogenophaga laconesensis]
MPLPATIFTPSFLRFEGEELKILLNKLRDPLTVHLYFILVSQADFNSGEQITNYKRLIELCTPPPPEKGKRMPPPTIDQVRRAVQWLVDAKLVARNTERNETQGMLRLYVRSRAKTRTEKRRPSALEHRVKPRGVNKKS